MTAFELQVIGLILVAFILGVVIGYYLRTRVFAAALPAMDEDGIRLESRQDRKAHALLRGGQASKSRSTARASSPAKAKPEPKPSTKTPKHSQPTAAADNLQEIKGIGSVLEKKLKAMGIERFEQIAAWTEDDIAAVDEQLNFRGRIQREEWVEQAQKLAQRERGGQ